MALTPEQLDGLEMESAHLSGLMLTCWGEPERLTRISGRYLVVLAALGEVDKLHAAYLTALNHSASPAIGRSARSAWAERPWWRRLIGCRDRSRWQAAYTWSLFAEADDDLRRVRDSVAEYRSALRVSCPAE